MEQFAALREQLQPELGQLEDLGSDFSNQTRTRLADRPTTIHTGSRGRVFRHLFV